jgi:thymidylate kinase
VSNTGWTRSPLLSETINEAKAGHELTTTTMSLLYAADFADRMEHQIIPALKAGFIVIADRYMYTVFAGTRSWAWTRRGRASSSAWRWCRTWCSTSRSTSIT